jgi:hypothetical protein
VLGLIGLNGKAEHFTIDAGAETESDLRSGESASDVPALVFAARLADLVSAVVVRMDLDAELLAREKKLDEQGKTVGLGRSLSDESCAIFGGESADGLSEKRTAGDSAVFSGKPDFSDGSAFNYTSEIGTQIASTPDALVKLRKNEKWKQWRHDWPCNRVSQS